MPTRVASYEGAPYPCPPKSVRTSVAFLSAICGGARSLRVGSSPMHQKAKLSDKDRRQGINMIDSTEIDITIYLF